MKWNNKSILVTGGTGSFGNQIIRQLVELRPKRIVIYSRDEKKQYDMQIMFKKYDFLDYFIGDVRDYERLHEASSDVDIIYHAAALKHAPNCEFHPFEAVKTNILGAENVKRAAIENDVELVVGISTDKAVKPVNVMGMTKAMQERIFLNPKNERWDTRFVCVRYGNVIGSRGSVIPFFKQLIKEGKTLPITSCEMTRFLLRLEEAVDLVFKVTEEGKTGQLFVKKMPSCYITDLANAMGEAIAGRSNYPIKDVGIRPGEKIHEVLVSEEEMRRAIETDEHYVIYPFGKLENAQLINEIKEYSSENTRIYGKEEIKSLLKQEGWA